MSSNNTVVFITGANTGLGYEAVKALLKSNQPYTILLGSRSVSKGEEAIKSLQSEVPDSKSKITPIQADVESDASINAAFDAISKQHGKLDVLINNAGAGFDTDIMEGKLSVREGWNKAYNINVTGTYILTSTFIPLLLKSSSPRLMFITSGTSSLIETEKFDNPALQRINASPDAGWPKKGGPNPIVSYRSSKTGMNMMVRDWSRVLKNDGVKVFNVSPGFLATGLNNVGVEALKKMGAKDPSEGGRFIKEVVEGKRDEDAGKSIRDGSIQPW